VSSKRGSYDAVYDFFDVEIVGEGVQKRVVEKPARRRRCRMVTYLLQILMKKGAQKNVDVPLNPL
jgi:hypothetical protein